MAAAPWDDFLPPSLSERTGDSSRFVDCAAFQPSSPCVGWEYGVGPELRRQGASFPALETSAQSLVMALPLQPALGFGLEWRRDKLSLGEERDSAGAVMRQDRQRVEPSLHLRLNPALTVSAHLGWPVGGDGYAAGILLTSHWPAGWTGHWAADRQRAPVTYEIRLPEYKPVPIHSTDDNHRLWGDLGLATRLGFFQWRGSLNRLRGSPFPPAAYAAGNQGWIGSQGGAWMAQGQRKGLDWRAEISGHGRLGQGRSVVFQSGQRDDDPIAYVPWKISGGAMKAALGLRHNAWSMGASAEAAWATGHLLRPKDPAGKWLWNRNRILSAYEGGVLGLFSRETWLGTGEAGLREISASTYVAKSWTPGSWRIDPGLHLSCLRLSWRGEGEWLRRRTELLLSTQDTWDSLKVAGEEEVLLKPALSLHVERGVFHLAAEASQLLPLHLLSDWGDKASPGKADENWSGGWSFGIKASLNLGHSKWAQKNPPSRRTVGSMR